MTTTFTESALKLNAIMKEIRGLPLEQKRLLNSLLVDSIKSERRERDTEATESLRIGQRVTFDGKTRGIIHGTIRAIGRTGNLKVEASSVIQYGVKTVLARPVMWTVPAGIVKAL